MTDEDEPGTSGLSSSASLPRANLQKLIKEALPNGQRISAELINLIVECCTEFVEMISSSANDVSTQEKKTTINPEHVVAALDQLGFAELKDSVSAFWQQWREENKVERKVGGKKKTGADQAGMSEEEQIALQQKMFAEARAFAAGQTM